jgi:hypothetical protein
MICNFARKRTRCDKPREHPAHRPQPIGLVTEFVLIPLEMDTVKPVKRTLDKCLGIRYNDVRPMQVFGLLLRAVFFLRQIVPVSTDKFI